MKRYLRTTLISLLTLLAFSSPVLAFDSENVETKLRFGKLIGSDRSPVLLHLEADAFVSKTQYMNWFVGLRWHYMYDGHMDFMVGQQLHSDKLNAFQLSLRLEQHLGWVVDFNAEFDMAIPFDTQAYDVRFRGLQSLRFYIPDRQEMYLSLDVEEETMTNGAFKLKVGPKFFYRYAGIWLAFLLDTNEDEQPTDPRQPRQCQKCECGNAFMIGIDIKL